MACGKCHQCNAYYFNSVRVQIHSGTERKRENIHFSHYAFFLKFEIHFLYTKLCAHAHH